MLESAAVSGEPNDLNTHLVFDQFVETADREVHVGSGWERGGERDHSAQGSEMCVWT